MKIIRVDVFGYELTYAHGEYVMSAGRAARAQDSTVVRLRTDSGHEGWGETSSLAGTYLPAFTGGTRAALAVLGEHLIGLDPTNISLVHRVMDGLLLGQNAPKSAVDIACWDLLGQQAGLPIAALLGGVLQEDFPLYEAVPLGSAESMSDFVARRAGAGIGHFQVKVGNDPVDDARRIRSVMEGAAPGTTVIADANGGWNVPDAAMAMRRVEDLYVFIEQPCRDLDDCALVSSLGPLPLILDESVVGPADLVRAKYDAKAGAVNIKLGRLGGLSSAARMRDLAQDLAMKVTIEDAWGGDITTAAVSHLAASTRPESLLTTSFFNEWTNEHVAGHEPRARGGRGSAPNLPGLGISVDADYFGGPLMSFPA